MGTTNDRFKVPLWCSFLAATVAYGFALAAIKGDGSGWRDICGNLSAPYVLPPFLIGAHPSTTNKLRAVTRGMEAVSGTILGFYLWEGLFYGLVTRNSLPHILVVFTLGLAVGSLFGVLGQEFRQTASGLATFAVGVPFLIEPLVQILPGHIGDLRGDPGSLREYPYLFAAEMLAGCLIIAVLRARRQPAPDATK